MEFSDATYGRELTQRAGDIRREEFALLQFINVLLRRRRWVCMGAVVCFVVLVALPLVSHRTYTVQSSFMPVSSRGGLSRLAGVAAQLGVAVPSADATESPAFFAELLVSRDVLGQVVATTYTVHEGGRPRSGTLVEFYESSGNSAAEKAERARAALRESIAVQTSRETGVVTYSVRARWPELAQQIAQRLLALLEEFNVRRRQLLASAEAQFVEERRDEAERELRSAEEALEVFLKGNRTYRDSPQLTLAFERLQRDVNMRQQVFSTLAQSYEQARIDAVRNTPVIQVVAQAELPVYPDRRRLIVKGLLGLLLGASLGTALAFVVEFFHQVESGSGGASAEFRELRRAMVAASFFEKGQAKRGQATE